MEYVVYAIIIILVLGNVIPFVIGMLTELFNATKNVLEGKELPDYYKDIDPHGRSWI